MRMLPRPLSAEGSTGSMKSVSKKRRSARSSSGSRRARPGASEVQEDAVLEALRQRRLVEHARQDQPILMERHQPLRVDPARSRRRLRPEQDKPAALTDRALKLPAEQHPQADLRIVEPDLE